MSYELALKHHYAEVRARITRTRPVVRVNVLPMLELPAPAPPPRSPRPPVLAWLDIVEEVAAKHKLKVAQLMKPGYRPRPVSNARQEVFYRLREERLMSWAQIGRAMGGFDHTTTLHGWRKHRERMGIE